MSLPGEYELMFMATLLQTWDLMNHIIADGVEHWKVTDELKVRILCVSSMASWHPTMVLSELLHHVENPYQLFKGPHLLINHHILCR